MRAEARWLRRAAAMLSASVLADSAIEHYRGSFENPAMYVPLISSALATAAATLRRRAARRAAYGAAIGVGVVGTAFHVRNVLRRPGGLGWLNLFYAAPVGAPAALSLAGLLGLAAERVEATARPLLLGMPAGRALAGLSSIGLAGSAGEACLLHFRGAFQNPFMWLPVTLPPVASLLMARVAMERPRGGSHRLTRAWLGLTTLLGIGGVGFHAYGMSRAMGGWRNWSQNLIDGPPLPAPPSFSALSIAGLAALSLIERRGG